ncbi:MAG TPA: hypothetical protein VGA70_11220 [Longimicrobiales bacterium]
MNFSNVARECGVSSHTAKSYFGFHELSAWASYLEYEGGSGTGGSPGGRRWTS